MKKETRVKRKEKRPGDREKKGLGE